MGKKADNKRQYIIEKAEKVFAVKGYRAVTMKDIVEACDISRGGLYLYFHSVEEIFKAVVENEDDNNPDNEKIGQMMTHANASELMMWLIREKKKEILRRKDSLAVAKYEYAFKNRTRNDVKEHSETEMAVTVFNKILERGVKTGEFHCKDTMQTAVNLVYAIEGMKVCSWTIGVEEKKIDNELVFLLRQFMDI